MTYYENETEKTERPSLVDLQEKDHDTRGPETDWKWRSNKDAYEL